MFHVLCLFLECKRRREGEDLVFSDSVSGSNSESTDSEDYEQDHLHTEDGTRYNSQVFFLFFPLLIFYLIFKFSLCILIFKA